MTITARLLVFTALFIVGKIMCKIICIALSLFMVSCQGIRNTATYNMELIYIEQGLTRQSITVGLFLKMKCCEGKKFLNTEYCTNTRDTYVTIKSRTAYHLGMMRYLGRLTETRPEPPKLNIEEYPVCE